MPLLIDLKPSDKVIINGAVVENVGGHTKLVVHNNCYLLREKEILTQESAYTPAARVYFALQCAYLFPEKRTEYMHQFLEYLQDYIGAAPSAATIASEILAEVDQDRLYRGLKKARKLITHESEALERFRAVTMEQISGEQPAGAKPAVDKTGG